MKRNRFVLSAGVLLVLALVLVPGCKKRSAEERGRDSVEEKAGFFKGVGDGLKDKGREAAESMSGGVVQVLSGLKEGVEGATAVQVRVSPELAEYGGKLTRVQLSGEGVVSAYLITEKVLNRELRLRALDKEDKEIGRAKAVVDFPADHAAYVDFSFDERVPLATVACFELCVGEVPPPKEEPKPVAPAAPPTQAL